MSEFRILIYFITGEKQRRRNCTLTLVQANTEREAIDLASAWFSGEARELQLDIKELIFFNLTSLKPVLIKRKEPPNGRTLQSS